MEAILLMVAKDVSKEYVYLAIEMKTDIISGYPKNNTRDIMECVRLCNSTNDEEDIEFVDMFGIVKHGGTVENWEEQESTK